MNKYIKYHMVKDKYNNTRIVIDEIYKDYKSLPKEMQEPATRYTLSIKEKEYNDLNFWKKMYSDLNIFTPDDEDEAGWEQWNFEYDFCLFHIHRLSK